MIVGNRIWDILNMGVLALTPIERWRAARDLSGDGGSRYTSQYTAFLVAATVALVVLILLLWWVSHRQKSPEGQLKRELFSENAERRGLSPRERQILLAITIRSGLGHSHDIFATAGAFELGATKLLAECLRTRTVEENERLKREVVLLAEKLGFKFQKTLSHQAKTGVAGSRDILVSKPVELIPLQHYDGEPIGGQVVRNDAVDMAVELEAAVRAQTGDRWRVRYNTGMSVWEFDTTVVSCDQTRIVLDHVDRVRFINRRRFPRVRVTMPAMVALFPFKKGASSQKPEVVEDAQSIHRLVQSSVTAPEFVPAVVTELAGPGLRIDTTLGLKAGDRVLVVFKPSEIVPDGVRITIDADEDYVIEDLALVQHCHPTTKGLSAAVELSGLNDAAVDELVRITNLIASKTKGHRETSDAVLEEMTVGSSSGQGR